MKKLIIFFLMLFLVFDLALAFPPIGRTIRVSTPVRVHTPIRTKAYTPSYSSPSKAKITTVNKVNTVKPSSSPIKSTSSTVKPTSLPVKPYKYVGTPTYHHTANYMIWYFILYNNNTHRNDTIKAKSKAELDKKADELKKHNQW